MKRMTAFFLVLCIALSITACGQDPDTAPSQNGLKDPTKAPTQPTTEPASDYSAAGKYWLYCMEKDDQKIDYISIVYAGLDSSYFQMNADGTAELCYNGKTSSDITWDPRTMTVINQDGESMPFTLEEGMLTFTMEGTSMSFVQDGSSLLTDIPSGYQLLHSYITENGEGLEGSTVLTNTSTHYVLTMTATAEGGIIWKLTDQDDAEFYLELNLLENSPTQTMQMRRGDFIYTGTFETAACVYSDVVFTSVIRDDGYDSTGSASDTLMGTYAYLMFIMTMTPLDQAQVSPAMLGFTSFFG